MPNFDFGEISPRVLLNEIDQSTLPPSPPKDGLLLIGRARKGPGLKPITVRSIDQFVDIFGTPLDGTRTTDAWRYTNAVAPNYAAYAAQAYLAAGVGPVKYIRLLGKGKNSSNKAGWTLGSTFSKTAASNKAAYGLFLIPSGNTDATGETYDSTLAAIIYTNGVGVGLSGTLPCVYAAPHNYNTQRAGAAVLVKNGANDAGFKLQIATSATATSSYDINFNSTSPNYIRNVLNTDPTALENQSNYGSSTTNESYFLGETFDVNVSKYITNQAAGEVYGVILGLKDADATDGFDNFQEDLAPAKTGWFMSQRRTSDNRTIPLFRLAALDDGVDFQNDYYVKITNLAAATTFDPRGRFNVQIVERRDGRPDLVVEEFANLTMDNDSPDFIGTRIGCSFEAWDFAEEGSYTEQGDAGFAGDAGYFPNISQYVRVELTNADNPSADDIPLGYLGPKAPGSVTVTSDDVSSAGLAAIRTRWDYLNGGDAIGCGNITGSFIDGWPNTMLSTESATLTVRFNYPNIRQTTVGAKSGNDFVATNTFGLWHKKTNQLATDASIRDLSLKRTLWNPHITAQSYPDVSSSYFFSLDEIVSSSNGATTYYWKSGSWDDASALGSSISYRQGLTGSTGLLEGLKIRQFAAPFYGGCNGTDVKKADPFNNYQLGQGADKYPHYSVNQAISMVEDQERIRYEMISMPGIINSNLIDKLITQTQDRGDALAIVDVDGIYRPSWDANGTEVAASITLATTWNDEANSAQLLASSYAATYFPNVRMVDTLNGGRKRLLAPPSVAGVGGIAQSEAASQPWFAPAGFNRGGLNRLGGANGPIVVGTSTHLTRDNRDTLYAQSINPIARFPSTGDTVIFGQKTMMGGTSALNRINVRRLMVYLKRQIGVIADTILFDQNVEVTWNRFKARAEEVLSDVKSELGVTDYKIILDPTTTTPEAIDRNVMYAQIMVKPARAIEYIVVDFIITRSGVEF